MTDGSGQLDQSTGRRPIAGGWYAVAYFAVFFAAMGLGGFVFFLGGVAIIVIPGSLPAWAQVAYVAFGIAGSVVIAVVAANGAFRLAAGRRHHRPTDRPTRA